MENFPRRGDGGDAYSSSPSSSDNSTSPTTNDEYQYSSQNLPFDFSLKDDQAESRKEKSDGVRNNDDDDDDGFDSTVGSLSSLDRPKFESKFSNSATSSISTGIYSDVLQPVSDASTQEQISSLPSSPSTSNYPSLMTIPHRGSLRRILNPSSFHAGHQSAISFQSHHQSSHGTRISEQSQANSTSSSSLSWPIYVINVATESEGCSPSLQFPHSNTESVFESNHRREHHHHQQPPQPPPCYQIVFDRQQYEFCTRLFAVLDTESQSFVGPDRIREFVYLHCPVVRRRDDAIIALRCNSSSSSSEKIDKTIGRKEEKVGSLFSSSSSTSPTFDEIWERTIHSDPQYALSADTATTHHHRIGIEGWMVFCRLLALAHHYESQRRFSSRHLQQMMRHKHGGGGGGGSSSNSSRDGGSNVVVVVENPPPGPPSLIYIRGLVDVEQERVMSHDDGCIPGWPFCPLPLLELDLDHSFVSTSVGNTSRNTSLGVYRPPPRGRVSVEPFTSSEEGDFILRFRSSSGSVIARRSYSDFEWLNAILKLHKRPGQGHLCGRILPPFPTKRGGFRQQHSSILSKSRVAASHHQGSQKDISERAIDAAKSGMGMLSSIAKNVWSEYVLSGSTPSSSPGSSRLKNKAGTINKSSPKRYGPAEDDDVPTMVAHRIERYLNYLLENDSLSTSFTLNAILLASQSGLESAKQTLHDYSNHRKKIQKSSLVADTTRGGVHHPTAASIFSVLVSKTPASLLHLQYDDETPWLRSAAQVAMALQFHGILETTGHESTSARIQHASLPKFCNHYTKSWDDEETTGHDKAAKHGKTSQRSGSSDSDSPRNEANFEMGVVNIDSELVDEEDLGGYDMLPSPGPSEEHRVLNAGSGLRSNVGYSKSQPSRSRFAYETSSEQADKIYDRKDSVLGSIRVENDIDKLRDIVRSINHTLRKLHQSSISIRSAQDKKNMIQLSLLRDVDSWVDGGGEVISQRALVEGVAALETFSADIEESNSSMTDDLLWQSSLATSAVAAVTEVRDAVRASHTASRAKSAAFAAAEKAKKAYESCNNSSSKEKIQHTQAEASTAQSHAIYATVVEYEANIAKKRSAVSLAQDVKSWNIHRKRELLQTCVQVAKSQREACRKAADAWESLREGLINSAGSSYATDEVDMWTLPSRTSQVCTAPTTVTSYANTQEIIASEISTAWDVSSDKMMARNQFTKNLESSSSLRDWENSQQDFSECVAESRISDSSFVEGFSECIVEAPNSVSSVVEEFADEYSSKESQQSNSEMERSSDNVYCIAPPDMSQLVEDYFSLHQDIIVESNSDSGDDGNPRSPSICDSVHSGNESEGPLNGDAMSMSMQSLIDGLMAWGEEDEQKNNEGTIKQIDEDQHNSLTE